jgi:hypothetical protein
MIQSIKVASLEEFQELLKNRDLRISRSIVNGVLNHLTTKKKNIHVLEINIMNVEEILDITIDRENFIEILEANNEILAENEIYEECIKVQEALKFLKQ